MPMINLQKDAPVIGVFGTCGISTFRDSLFASVYADHDVQWFNPQVTDWNPAMAEEEAHVMATAQVMLWPITRQEYSLGSLAEIGFSAMQSVRLDKHRDFIILIEHTLDERLKGVDHNNPDPRYKESVKMRKLAEAHLRKLPYKGLYLVNSLEEMVDLSLELYCIAKARLKISSKSVANA